MIEGLLAAILVVLLLSIRGVRIALGLVVLVVLLWAVTRPPHVEAPTTAPAVTEAPPAAPVIEPKRDAARPYQQR